MARTKNRPPEHHFLSFVQIIRNNRPTFVFFSSQQNDILFSIARENDDRLSLSLFGKKQIEQTQAHKQKDHIIILLLTKKEEENKPQ